MLTQGVELSIEQELAHGVPGDFIGKLATSHFERLGIPSAQLGGPIGPRPSPMGVLQRHEQRVGVEPFRLPLPEPGELNLEVSAQSAEGEANHRPLVPDNTAVVDSLRLLFSTYLAHGQETIANKKIRRDEVDVARRG